MARDAIRRMPSIESPTLWTSPSGLPCLRRNPTTGPGGMLGSVQTKEDLCAEPIGMAVLHWKLPIRGGPLSFEPIRGVTTPAKKASACADFAARQTLP